MSHDVFSVSESPFFFSGGGGGGGGGNILSTLENRNFYDQPL